jgi:hypothetical protein
MKSIESLVEERREHLPPGTDPVPPGASEIWGLALSGGGIRSATFCLGLLRSLAQSKALQRFDEMSTVSGGGYVGSMLGKMLHEANSRQEVDAVYEALAHAESRWFTWWLRANGRYLIPRGVRDRLFAAALFIRNLIGIHAEVAVATLLLSALLALVNVGLWWLLSVRTELTLHWFSRDVLAWMPTLWLFAAVPAFLAVVACCIYWALPTVLETKALARKWMVCFWVLVVAVLVYVHPSNDPTSRLSWPQDYWIPWAALLVLAGGWILALIQVPHLVKKEEQRIRRTSAVPSADHLRGVMQNHVTETLVSWVAVAFAILLAGLLERLAWFVAFELTGAQGWYGAALLFVAAAVRVVLPKVAPASGTAKPMVGVPLLMLGQLLGWVLTAALLVWWVSVGYSIIFAGFLSGPSENVYRALLMALLCGLYIAITSGNVGFLNASSLHGFYRARLTRSFLGAGNDSRRAGRPKAPPAHTTQAGEQPAQPSVLSSLPSEPPEGHQIHHLQEVFGDDDVAMETYAPHRHGGLIHLLNVCLNESNDGRGGLFNQDRRGQPFTVGPGGIARIGLRPWSKLLPTGSMTLGTWMAVSGAAVSPGMGSMTRPGLSALIALTGMRLGLWWDSHGFGEAHGCSQRRAFPVKTRVLLNEILGRFKQSDRDWFLSDGGHFENTGAYALLSCRARLIVLADCGADPLSRFADLENLVRKARVDLGADITFLQPKGPPTDPRLAAFGSLNDLKFDTSPACLALARIRYRPEAGLPSDGVMVIVKPNVSLDLPVDLHNFKADHPEFPQQSTTDQFFSEAQWESYFVLGKVIGSKLDLAVLRDMGNVADKCFVEDHGSVTGSPTTNAGNGATPASARLPARLAGTTIAAASIGVGAVASLGVATWQALDAVRSERAAKTAQDRAVLKELSDHFGQLGSGHTPDAALPAVASTLLRIGEAHCKAEGIAWFRSTPSAVCMLRSARALCETRTARMPSCAVLQSSSDINCLDPDRRVSNHLPQYWAVELHMPTPVTCPVMDEDLRADPTPPAASTASETSASNAAGESASSVTSPPPASPPASPPAPAPAATGGAQPPAPCSGYTVYTQIYGGDQRDLVWGMREPWSALGAVVPPIEDVNARATRENRPRPRPYAVTTVLHPNEAAIGCARAVAAAGQRYTTALKRDASRPAAAQPAPDWQIRRIPASLKPGPKAIEVWIAPAWAEGALPVARH